MLGQLDPKLAWYVARSSGLVTWALATAGITWGLLLSSRLIRRRGLPAWLLDLHRHLGFLTLVFTGVHLAGLWFDNSVHFAGRELFVPMASSWRPGAVAWGIAAFYLLVAVQLTSWLRRHIGRRIWRWIHLSSIPMYAACTVHGFQAGSDKSNTLVQWSVLVGMAIVLFVGVFRMTFDRTSERRTLGEIRERGSAATRAA